MLYLLFNKVNSSYTQNFIFSPVFISTCLFIVKNTPYFAKLQIILPTRNSDLRFRKPLPPSCVKGSFFQDAFEDSSLLWTKKEEKVFCVIQLLWSVLWNRCITETLGCFQPIIPCFNKCSSSWYSANERQMCKLEIKTTWKSKRTVEHLLTKLTLDTEKTTMCKQPPSYDQLIQQRIQCSLPITSPLNTYVPLTITAATNKVCCLAWQNTSPLCALWYCKSQRYCQ